MAPLAHDLVLECKRHLPPRLPAPVLVGAEQQVQAALGQLRQEGRVWLWGPGGSGKTELARRLVCEVQQEFSNCAFVELGFDDDADDKGLLAQHVCTLLDGLGLAPRGTTLPELQHQLHSFAAANKVLLLVDNIFHTSQVNALLPPMLAAGSLVIANSRSEQLTGAATCQGARHMVRGLSSAAALQLLRNKAGRAPASLEHMEAAVIAATGPPEDHLPLAVVLAGSALLEDSSPQGWQGVLQGLHQVAGVGGDEDHRLNSLLSYSLRAVQPDKRGMFLDVAAVSARQISKEMLLGMWESMGIINPRSALQLLVRRSLLTEQGGRVGIHDVLRALGRHMLSQPQQQQACGMVFANPDYGSRLWVDRQLRLQPCQLSNPSPIRLMSFEGMHGQSRSGLQPHKSIFIRTMDGRMADLENEPLMSLSLSRCVQLVPFPGLALVQLQHLDISYCDALEELPAALGALTQLTSLQLMALTRLGHLPPEVSNLVRLRSLRVNNCDELQQLQDLSALTAVTYLDLSGCSRLVWPESVSRLLALQDLTLHFCTHITEVPIGLSQLRALTSIVAPHIQLPAVLQLLGPADLEEQTITGSLNQLPDRLWQLTALRQLRLWDCPQLAEVPDAISRLSLLEVLEISVCNSLVSLPESVGELRQLCVFEVSSCGSLVCLPAGLGLVPLTQLVVSSCDALEHLPAALSGLTALERLDVCGCSRLVELPDMFGSLAQLSSARLSKNVQLRGLPSSFSSMSQLCYLDVCECSLLVAEVLQDELSGLTSLSRLEMGGSGLVCLPGEQGQLRGLPLLELEIRGCPGLWQLPQWLSDLTSLTCLVVKACGIVSMPTEIGALSSLSDLCIEHCAVFRHLPDTVSGLTKLQSLSFRGCDFEQLPTALTTISSLRKLDLCGCAQLVSLPDGLSGLAGLTKLNIGGPCNRLDRSAVPALLAQLPALRQLYLPKGWTADLLPPELLHKGENGQLELCVPSLGPIWG